jgi:oxygen-independent coproporphyrinogen III oxidase
MNQEILRLDADLLLKFDRPVPRYTSYPTAPQFRRVAQEYFVEKLQAFDLTAKPLSLYLHIPFCKSMCLFCGCSVVLNRNPERQARYLAHLIQEIERTAGYFRKKRGVCEIHLGGGTPTSLTEEQFETLMACLHKRFDLAPDAELSIEIDPRTVFEGGGSKLAHLRRLGFNRVSFGVQDLDPAVQEAVKRRQTEEMTFQTVERARDLGFSGINIDLIYGLPLQTRASFAKTAEKIVEMLPDRIAFYSYAKVPWLKSHQKAIPDSSLPSTEEKLQIYVETREAFFEGGYLPIGMDHFVLPGDTMAEALREKRLTRNFQGYAVKRAEDMLGFGMTSIGFFENAYFQNEKTLEEYEAKLGCGELPMSKGYPLQEEDLRRRFCIQSLMCRFDLDKAEFSSQFGLDFDAHFAPKEKLEELKKEGLIEETQDKILPTPLGRLFIRHVASAFDAYLGSGQFSRAV